MKISVCLTLYNEERSVEKLLLSLLAQSREPDEIVVVDGGSSDGTVRTVRRLQKEHKKIKLFVKKSTRTKGRNLAVTLSKNEVVAITDGDCVAHKDWLEKITAPFEDKGVDMVAGFYNMKADSKVKEAIRPFIGVTPEKFDSRRFLPSTRSIAFRKRLWKKLGGFPDTGKNSAEDTEFNYLAVKRGAKIARVKGALVDWEVPGLFEALKKFYLYAKWDAQTSRLSRHNVHVLSVFARYAVGVSLFLIFPSFAVLLVTFYFLWAYKKAGIMGIPLQFLVDGAVMAGFFSGLRYNWADVG